MNKLWFGALAAATTMAQAPLVRADVVYQLYVTSEFDASPPRAAMDLPPLIASVTITDAVYRQGFLGGTCETEDYDGAPTICNLGTNPFVLGAPGRVPLSGVGAVGNWPARTTAKSLGRAGQLSTAVVIAGLR